MSYVDAYFDRDSDIIRVVERNEGKRLYTEYPVKYTFYYDDPKGKHKYCYEVRIFRHAVNTGQRFTEITTNGQTVN